MTLIPIQPETLEIITKLNDGVTPEIEDEDTVFVYNGEDKPSEIITENDASLRCKEKEFYSTRIDYVK